MTHPKEMRRSHEPEEAHAAEHFRPGCATKQFVIHSVTKAWLFQRVYSKVECCSLRWKMRRVVMLSQNRQAEQRLPWFSSLRMSPSSNIHVITT